MNGRRLLDHIAFTVVVGVGGTLAGGIVGSGYSRLSDVGGWDALSLVLGGLMIGGIIGLLIGFCGAFFLPDQRLRKTTLIVFLIDLVVIVGLAVTDYLD